MHHWSSDVQLFLLPPWRPWPGLRRCSVVRKVHFLVLCWNLFARTQDNLRVNKTAVRSPLRRISRHSQDSRRFSDLCNGWRNSRAVADQAQVRENSEIVSRYIISILLFRSSMKEIIASKQKSTTVETALRERFALWFLFQLDSFPLNMYIYFDNKLFVSSYYSWVSKI